MGTLHSLAKLADTLTIEDASGSEKVEGAGSSWWSQAAFAVVYFTILWNNRVEPHPDAHIQSVQELHESSEVVSKSDMYLAMQEMRTIWDNAGEIWPVVDEVLGGEDPNVVLERSALEQD